MFCSSSSSPFIINLGIEKKANNKKSSFLSVYRHNIYEIESFLFVKKKIQQMNKLSTRTVTQYIEQEI